MVEEHARRKSLLASIFCSADAVKTFLRNNGLTHYGLFMVIANA